MSVGVARLSYGDTIQPFEGNPEASELSSKVRRTPGTEEKQRKMIIQSLTSVPGIGYHSLFCYDYDVLTIYGHTVR